MSSNGDPGGNSNGNGFVCVVTVVVVEIFTTEDISSSARSAKDAGVSLLFAAVAKLSEKINKLGLRSSDTAPIYFDNVCIPQRYRIGNEGEGFQLQMQQFQEERIFIAASVLVVLDNCINQTIKYCSDRNAFGKPIINNQAIQFRLAELQTEIEALRSLVYRACEKFIKDMINNDQITKNEKS